MRLLWVELVDFRNHRRTRLEVPEGLVTLVGPNGEGKTNLLEAMHFLLTLTSPRVSKDAQMIREGVDTGYVRGETAGRGGKTLIEIEIRREGANRVQVDRTAVRRRRDLRSRVRSVFFGPQDLRIVQGEPGARRDLLDEAIRSLWPPREAVLSAYDKVLRQRNKLLKEWQGSGEPPGLETWDTQLADAGAAVVAARAEATRAIGERADTAFRDLSGYGLEVRYEPNTEGDAQAFLERLSRRRGDELARRITLVGPHRDDVHMGVRDMTVRAFASHGEAWGAALAIRLALAAAVEEAFGEAPLVILDDPFSALDPARRDRIAQGLGDRGQVLVSVADESDVPADSVAVWDVAAGDVRARDRAGDD